MVTFLHEAEALEARWCDEFWETERHSRIGWLATALQKAYEKGLEDAAKICDKIGGVEYPADRSFEATRGVVCADLAYEIRAAKGEK